MLKLATAGQSHVHCFVSHSQFQIKRYYRNTALRDQDKHIMKLYCLLYNVLTPCKFQLKTLPHST